MSTKTTLKRIALVAVAATGFGLMSAVPSNAASTSDSLSLSSVTSSTTVGTSVSTVLNLSYIAQTAGTDTISVTAALQSSPASSVAFPTLATTSASGTDVNAYELLSGLVLQVAPIAAAPTFTSSYTTASLIPTHAGTYTIKFTPALVSPNAGPLNSVAITWTVTVVAAGTATAAQSTSFLNAGTGIAATADATVTTARTANTANGSQVATIRVTSNNSVPTLVTATTILTATISGPGTLGFGGDSGTNNLAVGVIPSSGRAITGLAGQNLIAVFADGNAGTAIITISAGTVVLATETVIFYGAISTLAATVVNPVIATTNAGGSGTGAITAIATDSGGLAVAGSTLYITSSDLTVLNASYLASGTTDSTGKATFNLPVGLKAGSVTLTVGNGSTLALTTITAPAVSVRVGSETPASVTVLFDKNAYVVGEAATVTVALLDAAGLPVANNTYTNIFTTGGLTSSSVLSGGVLTSTSVVTADSTGTQVYKVNMPVFATDVVLSAVGGTGLPAAARVAITSSMASVSNSSSDAATDAANAATDAANYAADAADAATTAAEEATAAAQAAQESADAATAAVVELSTKVSALVDALRAQVTSLGNYVAKVAAALGRVGTRLNQVLYNQKQRLLSRN